MSSYTGFASMYDILMADTPYEAWTAYIDKTLKEHLKKEKPLILDLACGTGNITLPLARIGYEMIGLDASADMLAEAQRKAYEENAQILFIAQDARELDLYGTIDGAVSVCDGLNYILHENELKEVFRRVHLFMNPGGIFIFDMNTEYKFKERLGKRTFEHKAPSGESYIWENNYDEEKMINEYNMLFFSLDAGEAFRELHLQRAYPAELVCGLLTNAGFTDIKTFDGYTINPPAAESNRVVYTARKTDTNSNFGELIM